MAVMLKQKIKNVSRQRERKVISQALHHASRAPAPVYFAAPATADPATAAPATAAPATAATAATAAPPPVAATAAPTRSWKNFLTRKKVPNAPKPNWMKYTSGTNSAVNSKPNTTQRNKPINASKEKARQGFLANVQRGLNKEKSESLYRPNTEATYTGEGNAQTRTDSAMQLTSDLNRLDRLLVLFKGALRGRDTIDLKQYMYTLGRFVGDLPSKHIFIKVMETREVFPKITDYHEREIKLADEAFIKEHKLEHVGMKKEKTTKNEKGTGKNGTNVQKYSEYTEAELDTIITNYKQTIYDDVLGLFIILTMYILSVFTTGDSTIFENENLLSNIKMLIFDDPQRKEEIVNNFKRVNTSVEENISKKKVANASKGSTVNGVILGTIITGMVVSLGFAFPPMGISIGVFASVALTYTAPFLGFALGHVGHKYYDTRYKIPKEKQAVGELLDYLYWLLTFNPYNEQYVGSKSRIRFTKDDYTFLKEFEPMFKGWHTDTELYNFVFLFTRERLKGLLGERYNHKRNLPEGWHEFKTEDGKTYYNSNEYSKNEPKSLDRYKLVSWVMPMVPFVNRRNYNDNITIHLPTEFSHGPKTPVQAQMGQKQVASNSGGGLGVGHAISGLVDVARVFR
jgi:hypothetical protein